MAWTIRWPEELKHSGSAQFTETARPLFVLCRSIFYRRFVFPVGLHASRHACVFIYFFCSHSAHSSVLPRVFWGHRAVHSGHFWVSSQKATCHQPQQPKRALVSQHKNLCYVTALMLPLLILLLTTIESRRETELREERGGGEGQTGTRRNTNWEIEREGRSNSCPLRKGWGVCAPDAAHKLHKLSSCSPFSLAAA